MPRPCAKVGSTVASKRYPLEPLQRLRADEVSAKERDFAEAAQGRASAEEERRRRERVHADYAGRMEAEIDRERALLEAGELSVEDLNRQASWRIRAESEKAALLDKASEARELEAKARENEAEKLLELAKKKAEAEIVEKHHANWERARLRAMEAQEEEAAEEIHAALLHRMRGGSR